MHDYSIDRHPKPVVLFVLAFIAIWVAPLINALIDRVASNTAWSSPVLTAVPVFAVFSLIYWSFNRYLWKVAWLRRFLLVPDLNGTWECIGKTALKNGRPADFDWNGTIQITQSWSRLLIHLRTAQSESKSVAASISHEPGVGYRLLYEYGNAPNADELDLQKHSGSAEIMFAEDCSTGEGHYFTDRHRQTTGTLSLTRKD